MLGGLGAFFAKLGTGAAGLAKKGMHGMQGLVTPEGEGMLPIPKTSSGLPDIDPLRAPVMLPEARTIATPPFVPATSTTPAMTPKLVLPSHVGPVATEPALANPSLTERPVLRRVAKDGVGAEWRQRMEEMRSGTPQETVWSDPYGQERYDYATDGGTDDPTKRGWRQRLKNFGAGAMAGGREGGVGGALGGGLAGLIGGEIDPAGGREMQFEMWKLPQLQQQEDRAYNRQTELAKLGEILSRTGNNQAQARSHEAGILRADAKDQYDRMHTDRTFDLEQAYKGKQMAHTQTLIDKAAYDLNVAQQTAPYKVIEQQANARMKELQTKKLGLEIQIKQATAQTEIDRANAELRKVEAEIFRIGAETEAARARALGNPTGGRGAKLAERWAEMRKKALDDALPQEERDFALAEMNRAADALRDDPDYEVSGNGGWSYVKPRPSGGFGPTPEQLIKFQQEHPDWTEEKVQEYWRTRQRK